MSEAPQEKLSESIMVRVTPSDMVRIGTLARSSGVKPATLARMGLLELINRLSAQAPELSPEVAHMVAAAAARGVDVRQTLTAALEAKLADDASNPQAAA